MRFTAILCGLRRPIDPSKSVMADNPFVRVARHPKADTSNYQLRMEKLSAKIFNKQAFPVIPKEMQKDPDKAPFWNWIEDHLRLWMVALRHAEKPRDLDTEWRPDYYPAHPQIRELTYRLRAHGLFRDEHQDFKEEIKRLKILRGKQFRVKGGMSGKRTKIKGGS